MTVYYCYCYYYIDKAIGKLKSHSNTLTTSQVQEDIKQNTNNNSTGPDKPNIINLKHLVPPWLTYLTSMLNLNMTLNTNTIPHTWKLANIIPIQMPNNDTNKGISQL